MKTLCLFLFFAQATDVAQRMVDSINAYLEQKTPPRRHPTRERLARIIGAVDPTLPVKQLLYEPTVTRASNYRIQSVRWHVWNEVYGEGLLLTPDAPAIARVIALPDADQTPEALVAQWAGRLAASRCQVLIPVIIDRADTWSGIPSVRMTNMPHREFIYRMAFEAGRHIIGYEVQKVRAALDWFTEQNKANRVPIALAGYAEGGLIAFYTAALDTRVDATLISAYFQPREDLWREPIYRDVWGLLNDFGDAEIAQLIAPRTLLVENGIAPKVSGPPPETNDRRGAAPNGSITTPPIHLVRAELERAHTNARLIPNMDAALSALIKADLKSAAAPRLPAASPERMHRQFDQLVTHTQAVLRDAPRKREQFWASGDARSHREYIWNEVIGRMPDPSVPANPHMRHIYDAPKFRGYEVTLEVWPGISTFGILLVPNDLKPGERRAVVVCQHGLEGRPSDVADPDKDHPAYHRFAARLAEQGFITYSPQNPYIGKDRFRIIQRKAHPYGLSLFSFIIGQHQRTLEWLATLPYVDKSRIGFYGLSYGGKTAMRVPPLLEGYALSICSGDFNEWVWKTTSVDSKYSYLLTPEYDMIEFDFANITNYSDLANLMAPRPFMVERGHNDGVAPDEWVAYEYAKVRRFYATTMHMPDRTQIEFFDGPHTINGKGTFEFLKRFLAK